MTLDQPAAESIGISTDEAFNQFSELEDEALGLESDEDDGDEGEGQLGEEELEGQQDVGDEGEGEGKKPEQQKEELATIESLADIAEALEQPLEAVLDNLKAKVKVNGEEVEVTLRELTNGYQKDADYRRKTTELSEHRQRFDQERQQTQVNIQQQHMVLGQVARQLEQMLIGDVDSAAMERLRAENPDAYNQRRWEIADRQKKFHALFQEASNGWAQNQQALTQQQTDQRQAILRQEGEALRSAIPDWSNEQRETLNKYLGEQYGYSPEDIGGIIDHRLVVIARKAMLYDQVQKKADVLAQKVKSLPKLQKPAKQVQPLSARKSALNSAKQRFSKTRSERDARALFEQIL